MALHDKDFRLSMAVSKRAKPGTVEPHMRTVMVHRLTDDDKAVWRVGLRSQQASIYCEACHTWTPQGDSVSQPEVFQCQCGALYQVEFVIYQRIEDDEGDPNG